MSWTDRVKFDPFDVAKPRLSRLVEKIPLRVNPEQNTAVRPQSRRVDFYLGKR
jgi:hypothetical protein